MWAVINTGYIEKGFLDLSEHAGEIQRYLHEDSKGKEVFAFLGKAIETLKVRARIRDEVINKVDKSLTYIADILTLHQTYAAKQAGAKEMADLNLMVEDALRMQASALEIRYIRVKKNLIRGMPRIVIDKSRLMQVLVNLIKNACEAFDEVSEEGKEKAVSLKSYQEGAYACLEVADNGIGIEPEYLQTLGRFGQSRKGSSGVGLYYCRMFLEASGGTLHISSEGREKGARVLVRIPVDHAGDKEEKDGKK